MFLPPPPFQKRGWGSVKTSPFLLPLKITKKKINVYIFTYIFKFFNDYGREKKKYRYYTYTGINLYNLKRITGTRTFDRIKGHHVETWSIYHQYIDWLMNPQLFTYKTIIFKTMLKCSFLSTFEEDKVTFSLEASKNMLDMHIFALFISSVGWDLDFFQRAGR